jgi:tetratricopeptide (TPR) repeat protein
VPHEIKAWAHSFVFDVLLPFYGVFLAVFLVALAIYLLLVAWHLLPLLRFDKACLAGNSPDPHEALRMARRARVLRIRFVPVASELRALELLGDADRAVQIASDSTAVPRPAWFTSRLQYAFYVAGRYRQALELEMGHRPSDARHASFSTSAALIELNRAAAEMSLGSWGAAEARLEGPLSDADSIPPVRTLRLLGLAGVLIHRGDGASAMAVLGGAARVDLPVLPRPVFDFTSAVVLMSLARWDHAEQAVRTGLGSALLRRHARDGLFLLSRIELGRDHLGEAERYAREAAAHPWRWQGGDGLLLWGDILSRIGRRDEAGKAWSLAVERDPESESARIAAARSKGDTGGAST